MGIAALVTWIITAGFGFVLLGTWLAKGGARQNDGTVSRIAPPLIFGHFLLAAAGLVLWIIFLFVEHHAIAWIAFIILIIVAVLGDLMFLRWLPNRASATTPPSTPESHFPIPVVAVHGIFAVTTVILVLLAAIGIGQD